ncbi:MAG: hypothetical protein WCS80_03245 [Bacilli bacterium]
MKQKRPQPLNEKDIDIYKWIKIVQSVILMVLGVIFIATAWSSENNNSTALSIGLGVAFAVYGVIDVISGYLLHHNPMNSEGIFGLMMISISVVLFYRTELLGEILSIFLITLLYGLSIMTIVFGVDLVLGKNLPKNITKAVFVFIGSAALIAIASVYVYYVVKADAQVQKWINIIIGGVISIIGVVSLVMLLSKIKNTKEAIAVQESTVPMTPNTTTEILNKDVKVFDYEDLKKNHNKKIHDRRDPKDIKQIEDSDDTTEDDDTKTDDKPAEKPDVNSGDQK